MTGKKKKNSELTLARSREARLALPDVTVITVRIAGIIVVTESIVAAMAFAVGSKSHRDKADEQDHESGLKRHHVD